MTTTTIEMTTAETVAERIARLNLGTISESRLDTLTIAHPLVNDAIFAAISNARRVARKDTIVLPRHHFETLSRGRGWARCGHGEDVIWGERVDGGYRVSPGVWSVGGHDGFKRKRADEWLVTHVQVGALTWTLAN